MARSNTAKPASKETRGKPFEKGSDSRRNVTGQKNSDRVEWTAKFNNLLAKKLDPEAAVDVLIKAYKASRPWAIQEVHERLMGKVTQPIDHSGELKTDNTVTVKVIHVQSKKNGKKENGSDNK